MPDHDELIELQRDSHNHQEWLKFHDSKNLALALSIEAAELNELFWLNRFEEQSETVGKDWIKEDLEDVFAYACLLGLVWNDYPSSINNLMINELSTFIGMINKFELFLPVIWNGVVANQ